MKKTVFLIAFLVFFGIFVGCTNKRPDIVIGTDGYTEQLILGQVLKLLIEDNTKLTVSCMNNLSSDKLFTAIKTGAIDACVEYTGSFFGNHHRYSTTKETMGVYDLNKSVLEKQYNIHMLEPLGFNNTYAFAARVDTTAEYGLKTISDLAKVSSDFVFGGTAAFNSRYDGLANFKKIYNLEFKEEKTVDWNERYFALDNNEIQVSSLFSTDGMLSEYNLVILEDDKHFFPPYHAVIIIRNETTEKHPELLDILNKLSGKLSDEIMTGLNYRVDVQGETSISVVDEFLKTSGLIRK
jgi:osmoprotectant transport system permease protein